MTATFDQESVPQLTLRQRLTRGGQAQIAGHVVRVVVQVGTVGLLAGTWGLHRFGDWLVLTAATNYIVWNDIGFVGAANNEMIMAVARKQRSDALEVFQAVSAFLMVVLVLVAIAVPLAALAVPLADLLNLSTLGNTAARWIVVMLGSDAMLVVYGGLLYGGFASEGRYGEGGMWASAIFLAEFCGLAAVVIAGGSPPLAAGAMLAARFFSTVAMYLGMRRRVPWLRFGKPPAVRLILKRLFSPALASGAFPTALMVNVQGMVLLLGIVAGPASVAIFSSLRTMSRGVIQLMASVFSVTTPEISRAFAEDNHELLRKIHRRGCQATVWLSVPLIVVLAVFGGPIMHVWTSGRVGSEGLLLYCFLAIAAVDSLWYTSLGMLFATNRHQRIALYYFIGSLVNLPVAYVLYPIWGVNGVALSVLILEVSMLVPVLRQALPAAHDNLRSWVLFIARPPVSLAALYGLRARLARS